MAPANADAKAQRHHLRGLGFLCTTSSTILDPLPEAFGFRQALDEHGGADFPRAEKACLPKHA